MVVSTGLLAAIGIALFCCGCIAGGFAGAVITMRFVYVKGQKWVAEQEERKAEGDEPQ